MSMHFDSEDSEDCTYQDTSAGKRAKRRKVEKKTDAALNVTPLLDALQETLQLPGDHSFDTLAAAVLPDFLQALDDAHGQEGDLRPLRRGDATFILEKMTAEGGDHARTVLSSLVARKLSVHPSTLRVLATRNASTNTPKTVTPISPIRPGPNVNPQTLDALNAIQTTPYENSFLSRILGFQPSLKPGAVAVDWETQSPWMDLMEDIRNHFSLMQCVDYHRQCDWLKKGVSPERDQPTETTAPIEYVNLRTEHLPQVHDILRRTFWDGIDVSDSLQYSPEKCTIVATYKNLVVGAAFLSSPQETYMTYLAVRAGWENAHIATTMLYYLITLNPNKDITLHVSINNPAMLLYNRFGFKAEEFIVGFYEDYLDPQSRASKNAFRLRLRR